MRNSLFAIASVPTLRWAHMVPAILGLLVGVWYLLPSVAGELANPEPKGDASCEAAEECFKSAAAIREKSGDSTQRDQALSIKLDQLRLVTERHPASLWAKRASLLSGVLLIGQNPAEAIRHLR